MRRSPLHAHSSSTSPRTARSWSSSTTCTGPFRPSSTSSSTSYVPSTGHCSWSPRRAPSSSSAVPPGGRRRSCWSPWPATTPARSSTRCPSATRWTRRSRRPILEVAEGVPLFLEQLVAHAAESGLADDRIPPTLDALLASRIDALEPGERAVLSRAAIVGALVPAGVGRRVDSGCGDAGARRQARVARAPPARPPARNGARVRPPARPRRRVRGDRSGGEGRNARTLRALARRAQ